MQRRAMSTRSTKRVHEGPAKLQTKRHKPQPDTTQGNPQATRRVNKEEDEVPRVTADPTADSAGTAQSAAFEEQCHEPAEGWFSHYADALRKLKVDGGPSIPLKQEAPNTKGGLQKEQKVGQPEASVAELQASAEATVGKWVQRRLGGCARRYLVEAACVTSTLSAWPPVLLLLDTGLWEWVGHFHHAATTIAQGPQDAANERRREQDKAARKRRSTGWVGSTPEQKQKDQTRLASQDAAKGRRRLGRLSCFCRLRSCCLRVF